MELQRTSLISQVVDILPHLGEGFVEACLIAFDWDVERTVAAILNNDLPPEIAAMNQSQKRYYSLHPLSNKKNNCLSTETVIYYRRT